MEINKNEIWIKIPGYEGLYEISSEGRIRSYYLYKGHGKMSIKPYLLKVHYREGDGWGYPTLMLKKLQRGKTIPIHRVLAQVFIPNPRKLKYVNHKNGDKTDYSLENLEWVTMGENQKHAYDTGLKRKLNGELNGRNKISKEDAIYISKSKLSIYTLADQFGIHPSTASDIKCGALWGTVTGIKYKKKNYKVFTEEEIIFIYTSKLPYKELTKMFGVAQSTIYFIRSGKYHTSVTDKLKKSTS